MKKLLKIFVLMVVFTILEAVNNGNRMNHLRTKRTLGGNDTSIIYVPYQVNIELHGVQFCGGSIIAKNWIITAAHCMEEPKEFYEIRAGSSFTRTCGSLHTIRAVIKHPNFTVDQDNHAHNDIALINVNQPFKFDLFRQTINLPNYHEITPVGAIGLVSGYHKPIGDGKFGNLQTVKLKVISKQKCYESYQKNFMIPKNQFCAQSSENGEGPCYGDSGGPFVINRRLHGMVSWGIGCGLHQFPDVFIKISPYRHWIDNIVRKPNEYLRTKNCK